MHPHLKEARDGHADKLRRIAGYHGTPRNPAGNTSTGGTSGGGMFMAEKPGQEIPNGPQASVGLASVGAEGKKPKRNLGKFARGGRTKHKGTTVNVMVSPHQAPMMPPPMPRPAAPPAIAPPGMAAGMPGPAGPPPGLPPGALPPRPGMPPMMPPHAAGGRAFKRGGKVASSTAPQYPQKVKTAHAQKLGAPKGFKKGGRTFDAGSLTGDGRKEKIKAYGKKAHAKPKKV
ncbi:MAG TPA: hypothetical protein VFA65_24155 [Bryobacteraceae bacterium]|nr:hypothetical protein [Bryobacteraceae bacterium]